MYSRSASAGKGGANSDHPGASMPVHCKEERVNFKESPSPNHSNFRKNDENSTTMQPSSLEISLIDELIELRKRKHDMEIQIFQQHQMLYQQQQYLLEIEKQIALKTLQRTNSKIVIASDHISCSEYVDQNISFKHEIDDQDFQRELNSAQPPVSLEPISDFHPGNNPCLDHRPAATYHAPKTRQFDSESTSSEQAAVRGWETAGSTRTIDSDLFPGGPNFRDFGNQPRNSTRASRQTTNHPAEVPNNRANAMITAAEGLDGTEFVKTIAGFVRHKGEDLPVFSGNPNDWRTFRECFERTTKAHKFSPDENLARLRKALKGEAEQIICDLLTHRNNIPRILETLEELYGDPMLIIKDLEKKAKAVPKVETNNPGSWFPLDEALRNLVTNIESLTQEREEAEHIIFNLDLLNSLVRKLPDNEQQNWFTETNGRPGNLKAFSSWVNKKAKISRAWKQLTDAGEPNFVRNSKNSNAMTCDNPVD